MELNLLGLFGSSSTSTTTAAAGDVHVHGSGSGTHHAGTEKMAALMSAAGRDDELRRRVVAAGTSTPLLQGFMQVPRLPPQDARGASLAASARGAIAGRMASQQQQPHHSAATTIQRAAAVPTDDDHATAKVVVFYAGATRVLDNVPTEMVEQFVLSVAKATGAQHQPADQRAASPSSITQMFKLWGSAHGQNSDPVVSRRKASLAHFMHRRTHRAETIAPYPRREIFAAATGSARNKHIKNKNKCCDEDALNTELKI